MQNVWRARRDEPVDRGEEPAESAVRGLRSGRSAPAREDAEAVEFVVLLGDSAEELAAAVAALS